MTASLPSSPAAGAAASKGRPRHGVQVNNKTALDRYPIIFEDVANATRKLPARRVLSYGCSTGEEALILSSKYFQDAQVIGVDVSETALAKARILTAGMPRVSIHHSTPETLAGQGPYEAIFAMSVLCRWPTSKDMDNIAALFPFDQFCAQVATLDAVLQPGGVLVIYNANYEFLHAPVSAGYDLVLGSQLYHSGNVKKFRPDGNAAPGRSPTACIYRKRNADDPATANLRILDTSGRKVGEIPRGLPFPA
jgi:SAM-dependent methyltransferase